MSTFDLARPADSSESEDDDYVPSAEESDGDASDAENEVGSDCEETEGKKRKKKGNKTTGSRKRRGGLFLDVADLAPEDAKSAVKADTKEETSELSPEEEKKKADLLWADFLRDVEPVPKRRGPLASGSPTAVLNKVSPPGASSQAGPATEKKVKITELLEFAGETIKVDKEVPADSKEARLLAKQEDEAGAQSKSPAQAGKMQPRGVGSVLNQLFNKKKKLSTLEKSKLDWENYKKTQGIAEDLQNHNRGKDGYLEKQAFLQRADVRQFEIEKNLRAKNRSSQLH